MNFKAAFRKKLERVFSFSILTFQVISQLCHTFKWPGIKVSHNAPDSRSRARKFKPEAFWLQNYWILQPEPTFLGQANYSNPISYESFKFHIFAITDS